MRRQKVKEAVEEHMRARGFAQGTWSLYANRGGFVLFVVIGGKMQKMEFTNKLSMKWTFWRLGFIDGYAAGVKAKLRLTEPAPKPANSSAIHATHWNLNGHDHQPGLPL